MFNLCLTAEEQASDRSHVRSFGRLYSGDSHKTIMILCHLVGKKVSDHDITNLKVSDPLVE